MTAVGGAWAEDYAAACRPTVCIRVMLSPLRRMRPTYHGEGHLSNSTKRATGGQAAMKGGTN